MSESTITPARPDPDALLPADRSLADGGPLRGRTAAILILVLLLYSGITDLYKASRKPFWFDEVCSIAMARQQTFSAILAAEHTSPEGTPPLFHYLQALTRNTISNEAIGYRLNPAASVLCLSICLFLFVRRRLGPTTGLIAAVFPLLTSIGTVYSFEARPYALVVGCLSLALLAWSRVERPLAVFALAFFLTLATSLHYYAIFAVVPFAAGEAVHWLRVGRFRPGPWLAMAISAVPLILGWPLLAGFRAFYGTHYFSAPSLVRIPAYYDASVALGDGVGAAAAVLMGLALLAGLAMILQRRPGLPAEVPVEEYVIVLAFLLLPFVGYAATRVMHGGLVHRYVLSSLLGISVAVAYLARWAGARASALLLALMLAFVVFRDARYWMVDARTPAPVPMVQEDVLQAAAAENLPLVISNPFDYLPMAYYNHGRDKFLALVDPGAAVKMIGSDSLDLSLIAMQPLLSLDVEQFSEFGPRHPRFLLYSRAGDSWNWWPAHLKSLGATLRPVLLHDSQTLFLVEFNTPPR